MAKAHGRDTWQSHNANEQRHMGTGIGNGQLGAGIMPIINGLRR